MSEILLQKLCRQVTQLIPPPEHRDETVPRPRCFIIRVVVLHNSCPMDAKRVPWFICKPECLSSRKFLLSIKKRIVEWVPTRNQKSTRNELPADPLTLPNSPGSEQKIEPSQFLCMNTSCFCFFFSRTWKTRSCFIRTLDSTEALGSSARSLWERDIVVRCGNGSTRESNPLKFGGEEVQISAVVLAQRAKLCWKNRLKRCIQSP